MSVRHIVLFRVHAGVSSARVEAALGALRSLGELPMVMGLRVEPSLDGRKGRVIVENAVFADTSALRDFRRDPRHVAVAEEMSEISDWWVGDYVE